MTYEDVFLKLIRSLAMAEYKADGYTLLARDFKILYCYNPAIQMTENTSNYLIRCCHHVNHYFEGAIKISINNVKELEGLSDETKVGNHWLLDKIGDINKLEKLIEAGKFSFDNFSHFLDGQGSDVDTH